MNPEQILQPTLDLIKETGLFIRREGRNFDRSKIEQKGLNDLVSYVDKQAEERLVSGLRQLLPGCGFIAEEGTAQAADEEYKWVIDPLDGTTNFLHGLPPHAVSVGLLQGRELVLGVVYEVIGDELFWAQKGQGAYCNGQRISVSPIDKLSGGLMATGFPYYDFGMMEVYLQILNEFMRSSHGLRRLGSAAVDLVYTAMGRFEGFYEYNLNAWDVAAGILIVQEAGGTVTDFKGGSDYLFGREIIATNGRVHAEVLEIIRSRWHKGQGK
ncbi:inositol monophosphatase family protein [Cesiribacter andamanensis]|uniref:Inositol-1-monophosphatase n=1 Tax=Cesiribacter andamanensis AMV16 TaxID=1279009 RepID=M7NZL2_9BACT|nr:inositol monophosphatase family protein [Cesiribacter andamanensis]EMR03774.1 Inositol-1-monophosphatase [Cesiribacter andamanensis AMV16]